MLDKLILAPYYYSLKIRHAMYDKGVIYKVHTTDVPTICVGNITAGGTGKTPHTEMILRTLLASTEWGNKNIAVLSRGHRRSSRGFQQVTLDGSPKDYGDEPLQIKRQFPNITVAVDRARVEGCDFLRHPEKLLTDKKARGCKHKELPAADLVILDDAFQHRSLRAYFNILLEDYNRPTYKDHLLPFGRLRDLPERLTLADLIIVTKCPEYMEDYEKVEWARTLGISDYSLSTCSGTTASGRKITVLFTSIHYCPLRPVFPEGDQRYVYAQNLILFTGIAKDTPLRSYLSDTYKIVRRFNFGDHHTYSAMDFAHIKSATKAFPTAILATTVKDSQRVISARNVPQELKTKMFQVPIEVKFLSSHEQEIFEKTLLSALRSFHTDY